MNTHGGWFLENAWLIPLIPAAMFAVILLFGKLTTKITNGGAYLGVASMAASLFFALGAAVQWIQRVGAVHGDVIGSVGDSIVRAGSEKLPAVEPVIKTWTWWQSGGVKYPIGVHIDGLAICLLVVVAIISTLVQIYSLEYLRGDRRFTHYFAVLTLFSAGMLAMVEADNMLFFLLGDRHRHRAGDRRQHLANLRRSLSARYFPTAMAVAGRNGRRRLAERGVADRALCALHHDRARPVAGDQCHHRPEQIQFHRCPPKRKMGRRYRRADHRHDFGGNRRAGHSRRCRFCRQSAWRRKN